MVFHTSIEFILLLQICILKGTFSFNLSAVDANAKPSISSSLDFPPKKNSLTTPVRTTTEIFTTEIGENGTDKENVQNFDVKILKKNSTNETFENDVNEASSKKMNAFNVFPNETSSFVDGIDDDDEFDGYKRSFNKEPDERANVTLINCTSGNDELARCNYSLAKNEEETTNVNAALSTVSSVAAAAGFCLASAILGYFGCVGYRRYKQRKYENTKIEAPEDVYDTTDLRYFEI